MDPNLAALTEQMARELASQASTIDELNGLLRGLMKSALQRMLDTEMDVHLGRKDLPRAARRRRPRGTCRRTPQPAQRPLQEDRPG